MGKMLIIRGATYTAPSGGGGGSGTIRPSSTAVRQAVEAYLTASGVDAAWETPLKTLVQGLMGAGIWDRLIGFYPFLGSTAASMAVNLRDPEASPLETAGNASVISYTTDRGVLYTAGGGYLKIQQTWSQLNDYHLMGIYTDNGFVINSSALFSPLSQGAATDGDVALFYDGTNVVMRGPSDKGLIAVTGISGIGSHMAASYGPAGTSIYHNGERQAHTYLSGGGFSNSCNNAPICLLGYYASSMAPTLNVRLECCSFGLSLSNSQMETLHSLSAALKSN